MNIMSSTFSNTSTIRVIKMIFLPSLWIISEFLNIYYESIIYIFNINNKNTNYERKTLKVCINLLNRLIKGIVLVIEK